MDCEELIKAWEIAAKDLQIKIQFPFVLKPEDGNELSFLLLVENFGSKQGTLVTTIDEMYDSKITRKIGYYFSGLDTLGYSTYNRDLFIDTLNDWGYYGEDAMKPLWYTGKPWTE